METTAQRARDTGAATAPGMMTPRLMLGTILILIVMQLPLPGLISPGASLGARLAREGVFWVYVAIILGWVLRVEHRPLSSVGLHRPTWRALLIGIAAAIVTVVGISLIYAVLLPALHLTDRTAKAVVQGMPAWFQLLLLLRAAIFEELFYRGFAIERLTEITRSRWLAAILSLAAFTFAHLSYWGWAHLIVVAFGGAVLTGLYLWRRDLATCMIAHFVTDFIGFVAA